VCYGRPSDVFQGSNWQQPDTIRTDDYSAPMGVPDDWEKYNRVVYPPTAPGETPRKGVKVLLMFVPNDLIYFVVYSSLSNVYSRKYKEILASCSNGKIYLKVKYLYHFYITGTWNEY
jgi:hypothetical protein